MYMHGIACHAYHTQLRTEGKLGSAVPDFRL